MSNQSQAPFISICVPAYKRPENVRRLLESLVLQTFHDYEIVVTDDSPDHSVKAVLEQLPGLPLVYLKNERPLGTPANWNYGISKARGLWIKIMHDDDWFAQPDSLARFAERAKEGRSRFIVCRYHNVFEQARVEKPRFPSSWIKKIINNPLVLLSENVIGPPSVTLIHRDIKETYDERMKWRVDIDYYVRLLQQLRSIEVIDEVLVNVGISSSQVTNSCINMPEVELPEGLLMLDKYGTAPLKNIRVYDAWWRILRNVGVRNREDLVRHTAGKDWPDLILTMVEHQKNIPQAILRRGLISKTAMAVSYLRSRKFF